MPPKDPRSRESEVLGSLPSTRPQRRSQKRATTKARATSSGGGTAPKARATSSGGGTAPKPRTKPRRTNAATKPKATRPATRKPAQAKPLKTAGRRPTAVRPSAATKNAGSTTDSGPARLPSETPPGPPQGIAVVGTAVQAAGELVELGVSLGSQALRGALRRIPRP